MTLAAFIQQLKTHIQQNQIKEVLEVMGAVFQRADSPKETELLLLSNRFFQHQSKVRMGVMDNTASTLANNQINFALISLIEELETDPQIQDYFNLVTEETVHRDHDQVNDLLESTLHRHQEDTSRELKQWLCTEPALQKTIIIRTADPRPQGDFYQKPQKIIFGRSPSCDIVIHNPHVSRQHTEISFADGYPVIKDLASKNGTYLNNKKITNQLPLIAGELRVDLTVFEVELRP